MTGRTAERGQAAVEFAFAVTLFMILLMGVVDLGKGIYDYNGVSQAAREIARAASVHPCAGSPCTLGNSPEIAAVIAVQKGLIPSLGNPTFDCARQDGSPKPNTGCIPGDAVKVTIVAPYTPLTPLMGLIGTWNLSSSSSVKIQ